MDNYIIPLVSGSLAGSILTMVSQHLREKRKIRVVKLDVQRFTYFLKDSVTIHYKGKQYENLSAYAIKLEIKSAASIMNQGIVLVCPQGAEILEYSVHTKPTCCNHNITNNTSDGRTEVDITFPRLEFYHTASIDCLCSISDPDKFEVFPKGVDNITYFIKNDFIMFDSDAVPFEAGRLRQVLISLFRKSKRLRT